MRPLSILTCALLLAATTAQAQDLRDGADVYGPCAACHGANGEGGKGGEYPRIAGQPAAFIISSLKQFQARTRYNLPMFPYTEPRELSEQDMKDVAAYVNSIALPTKPPEFKESDTALDRLLAMEKVLIVPRTEGDLENGEKVYRRRCKSCHGRVGQGNAKRGFPLLMAQYPNYLQRQWDMFLKGVRPHEAEKPGEGVTFKVSPKDWTDVLAWLTSVQGESAEAGAPDDDKDDDAK